MAEPWKETYMKKQGFTPRLESLESRWCPSAAALSGSSLWIIGDSAANVVQVIDDGAGNVKVTLDGGAEQSFSGVKTILAKLGGGDDTFDYKVATTTTEIDPTTGEEITTTTPADLTGDRILKLDLGDGNDTVNLDFSGGLSAARLMANVHGRDGNDSLTAEFGAVDSSRVLFNVHSFRGDDTVDLDFGGGVTGGWVQLNLHTHFGNDTVKTTWGDLTNTRVFSNTHLLHGDDTFEANFNGALEGTTRARFHTFGHHGNDAYTINGTNADIAASALLDLMVHDQHGDESLTLDYQGLLQGKLGWRAALGHGQDIVDANFDLTSGVGGPGAATSTGTLWLRVRGGHGNDDLAVTVLAPAATGGGTTDPQLKVNALVDGHHGNDNLTLKVEAPALAPVDPIDPNAPAPEPPEPAADVAALLDGGKGHDTCVASSNVIVRNCEG
jgi:hypothetical protein